MHASNTKTKNITKTHSARNKIFINFFNTRGSFFCYEISSGTHGLNACLLSEYISTKKKKKKMYMHI